MKAQKYAKTLCITALGGILSLSTAAWGEIVQADLDGYQEAPAISTSGTGKFIATINEAGGMVEYELSYSGLTGDVRQAHIHLGQMGVSGGISVFLCTNLGNGPNGDEPACPQTGTVRGTFNAADVTGPAGQGISAGEFAELIDAIRNGATYANVHSSIYPSGEIRGQIRGRGVGKPF